MPHSVQALAVEAGLVGGNHSGEQGLAIEVLPDLVGPFVNPQKKAYAVAGAVAEVALGLPQRAARNGVQLAPGRALGEDAPGQVDVSAQDKGVVLHFQIGARTHRDGTGYVRCAKDVLAAGVIEVKAVGLYHRGILLRSDVVRKGAAGAVGRYGGEAFAPEAVNLRAQGALLYAGVPFGDALAALDGLFQPVKEAFHCQSVIEMRQAHPLYFGGVFHCLAEGYRGRAADAVLRIHHIVNVVVQGGRIHVCEPLKVCYGEEHIVITIPCEPAHFILGYYQIGYDKGVVVYVACTYVKQPGNLVQGGEEHIVASFGTEEGPKPFYLVFAAFPHLGIAQLDYWGGGYGRAVSPEAVQKVRDADYAHFRVFVKGVFDFLDEGDVLAEAVNRNVHVIPAAEGHAGQPFRYEHLLRNTGLVQDNAGAFQLLHSLDEVSGVRPQPRVVKRDHNVPGLSGEAGKPFHLLPARCRVLAAVRVRSAYYDCIPTSGAHHLPERLNSLCVIHIHTPNIINYRSYFVFL